MMTAKAVLLPLLLALCGGASAASDLSKAMYTRLEPQACVRLLHADGSIGCQTPRDGAVGILYRIETETDLEDFAKAPEDDYIALVKQSVFAVDETVSTLKGYGHCKGILVYNDDFQTSSTGWSPDAKDPNADYGLPNGASGQPDVEWNAKGSGLHWENINFPIFLLDEADQERVFTGCYDKYNTIDGGHNPAFPLCAVELSGWMHGTHDTPTCLRRGYCDPLGSRTAYGSMRELNSTDEVVMLSAQVDSMALFHTLALGSDADMSGAVALLAAARLLGNHSAARELKRNIMFTLFNGEAFGYIGSSRLFYDMRKGDGGSSVFPTPGVGLNTDRITSYIEVNQALMGGDALKTYVYKPTTEANPSTAAQAVLDALDAAATAETTGITFTAQADVELPPASLRSLLYEIKNTTKRYPFGGVVITDHDKTGFANTFYHSRFDNAQNVDVENNTYVASPAAWGTVCHLAGVLARTAWALADDIDPADVPELNTEGICEYVAELLQCIMIDSRCDLVTNTIGSFGSGPMNRYVGVYVPGVTEAGTAFLQRILADGLATDRQVTCKKDNVNSPSLATYRLADGRCIESYTFFWDAVSPAFTKKYNRLQKVGTAPDYLDGRDPRWATWTESQWDSIKIRQFLVDDPKHDAATLGAGIAFFVVCVFFAWLLSKYAEVPSPTPSLGVQI